jgi:hypothetical protein
MAMILKIALAQVPLFIDLLSVIEPEALPWATNPFAAQGILTAFENSV